MEVKTFDQMTEGVQNFLIENQGELTEIPTPYTCKKTRREYSKTYNYLFSIADESHILVKKTSNDCQGGENTSQYLLARASIPEGVII